MSKPRVTTRCPANARTGADRRIVEFHGGRAGDGGGLMSIRQLEGVTRVYLRREPTIDTVAVHAGLRRFDVVAYRDAAMRKPCGRWPWHHTHKPRRNSLTVVLNCRRWNAVWQKA